MATISDNIPPQAWDNTIAALGGGILQSRAWALFQQNFGRKVLFAQGSRWAWQAHIRQSRGIRYLYAPYGPIATDLNSHYAALTALYKAGESARADFIRFEPVGPVDTAFLKQHDAKPVQDVQPSRTLILDLAQSETELRHGITQSNRNLINTAANRGITCASIANPSDAHIRLFLDMLHNTVSHDHFQAYPDGYYRQTLNALSVSRAATLYFAHHNLDPIAGAIVFDFGGTRYYAHAAAFQTVNRKFKAAVPLLWRLVTDAKNQGATAFDFWGIAPTDNPADPKAGLTRFKQSFGGQIKQYAGTWDMPMHPVKYTLYRTAKAALKLTSA